MRTTIFKYKYRIYLDRQHNYPFLCVQFISQLEKQYFGPIRDESGEKAGD